MNGVPFQLRGDYRVQSWRRPIRSSLAGRWIEPNADQPSEASINAQLASHPLWRGCTKVQLRAAEIDHRSGAFVEPDILYKHSNFAPAPDQPSMTTNIVDVRKAEANWRRRIPVITAIVGADVVSEIGDLVGDVKRTAADEYMFHEAGHCLGYTTDQKYADSYFRPGGRIAWGLVYAEELRADLVAFGLAAETLAPDRAAALLLYNLLLRLGAHIEALEEGVRPYGPIPRLLLGILTDIGVLARGSSTTALRFTSLFPRRIADGMVACGEMATRELVAPEACAAGPVEAAIVAARWVAARHASGGTLVWSCPV